MAKLKTAVTVILFGLLHSLIGQMAANAQSTNGVYSVKINTPGTFGQVMLQTVNNWSDVVELSIQGFLDSCDMNCFSKMQNIERLDLRKTDITKIHGCADLKKLRVVALPITTREVADSTFAGCSLLQDINLDSVCKIGDKSFYHCIEIKDVQATLLQSIGKLSFAGCNQLETVSAPNVITVGEDAFNDCNSLKKFDFSSVKYLEDSSFGECYDLQEAIIPNLESLGGGWSFIRCRSLKNVYLGEKITEISPYTFYGCRGLSTVKIPHSVQSIGRWAFGDCQMSLLEIPEGIVELNNQIYGGYGLDSLVLPASLKTLETREGTVFGSSSRLKDLFCKSIIPLSETGFDDFGISNATLHVPACSVNNYKNSEIWNSFDSIVPLEDEIKRIEIDCDFNLSSIDGISDNAELILTNSRSNSQWVREDPAAHLTFSADQSLKINRFTQVQNWALNAATHKPYSTTLIANNVITADTIDLKLTIKNFHWNFISFPFDVCVDDISLPENTGWVIRKYSGQDRATMSGNSWQDLKPGMMLYANEGYIIHATLITEQWDHYITGPYTVDMNVYAVDNMNKNKIFATDNVSIPLKEFPSEFGHNRSWNLVGNPYPCYFDIHGLNFFAPLTIWDEINETYEVVSPLDDIYVLRPNEAFFVQKNDQSSSLDFDCEKRLHSMKDIYDSQHDGLRLNNRNENYLGREVYNFYISNGTAHDKSRLVLNELAKVDYELERDASKFLSFESTTPQIFNYQDGVRYAINERPADTEGYYLGIYVGVPGEYTLKMDSRVMDAEVYLTDTFTGKKINLINRSYTFISDKGRFDSRFKVSIIKVKVDPSSINTINTDCDNTKSDTYNIKGQRVTNTYKGLKIVNGKKTL